MKKTKISWKDFSEKNIKMEHSTQFQLNSSDSSKNDARYLNLIIQLIYNARNEQMDKYHKIKKEIKQLILKNK